MTTESLETQNFRPLIKTYESLPVVTPGPGIELSHENAARKKFDDLNKEGCFTTREGQFFYYGDEAHCVVAPDEVDARAKLILMAAAKPSFNDAEALYIQEMRLVEIHIEKQNRDGLNIDTRPMEAGTRERLTKTLGKPSEPPEMPRIE